MAFRSLSLAITLCAFSIGAQAAPVFWVDWTSGTAGANGSAQGVIDLGPLGADPSDIGVNYNGEIAFIQTSGGTNYWTGPFNTYQSAAVDNRPGTPDIIALSASTSKTLSFTSAIDDLFFAVVSLNGNGYEFNEDFTIESFGPGFWGNGTLTKQDMGNGKFRLLGTGEPHGTIHFNRAVSSITWTSLTNEFWNGFTIGTYGAAAPPTQVPEPATLSLLALSLLGLAAIRRRKQ